MADPSEHAHSCPETQGTQSQHPAPEGQLLLGKGPGLASPQRRNSKGHLFSSYSASLWGGGGGTLQPSMTGTEGLPRAIPLGPQAGWERPQKVISAILASRQQGPKHRGSPRGSQPASGEAPPPPHSQSPHPPGRMEKGRAAGWLSWGWRFPCHRQLQ